ncbi:ZCHC3 protein, partial [Atractosteus spatula]|nr:ZCHC3 protein [Atractosteus spatula]
MTVFFSDPFMPEEDLVFFLNRFVDLQGAGKKELDKDGVWSGKRTYLMRLRLGKTAEEGVIHPPAFFMIGSHRGYLVYSGQPLECRACGGRGHFAAQCTSAHCKRCGEMGHVVKDCVQEKRCFKCDGVGHVSRFC